MDISHKKIGEMIQKIADPDYPFFEELERLSGEELRHLCEAARRLSAAPPPSLLRAGNEMTR